MEYKTFQKLIEEINEISPYKVQIISHVGGRHIGIKLVDAPFPISINESEFNFIRDTIEKYGLKTGVELSTGIGISTLSVLDGFKITGGHLISIDSYYEEIHDVSQDIPVLEYNYEDINLVKEKSRAYNLVKSLIKYYELENFINLEIGWSPKDLIKSIKSRNKKLDFVFLDCPKCDEEFERDITKIQPFMEDRYVIFVHDTHMYTDKSYNLVKRLFNQDMKLINEYYKGTPNESKRHFSLAVISNIL